MVLSGKYELIRQIGAGGFGKTYLAVDCSLGIEVSVKELTNTAEKGKSQFLQEARVMGKFSHEQGIVNVRDFFEERDTAYIVMEYLEGVDLSDYIREHGAMSLEEAMEKLEPVMEVLKKIHWEGRLWRSPCV